VPSLYKHNSRWTTGCTGTRQGIHIWLCLWHGHQSTACL